MKRFLLTLILGGCLHHVDQWEGIPEGHICDFDAISGGKGGSPRGGLCLSGGKTYACVVDHGAQKVVCQLQFTEILCTKIVNVETTCDKKEGQ